MKSIIAACACLACLASTPALAQFERTSDAFEYRTAVFTVMDHHFDRIGDAIKNKVPYDAASVASDAALIQSLSRLPWVAFVPNSRVGDSRAKPEIWTKPDQFKAIADKLGPASDKLVDATKGGDQAAVKAAFVDLAGVCKECHDKFRAKR